MIPSVTEKNAPRPFSGVKPPQSAPGGIGKSCMPTHDEIARRAYEIYVDHDRSEGRSEQDWRQAEEELVQKPQASSLKPQAQFRS